MPGIAALNQQVADDAAARRFAWLPEFHRKVSQRERISSEDVEDFGSIPEGYVRDRFVSDWWIFKGN